MVFPRVTNQEMNRSLKIIGEICGIKKNLTFHLARHTFATSVTLMNGVPIETISKMLGHFQMKVSILFEILNIKKFFKFLKVIQKVALRFYSLFKNINFFCLISKSQKINKSCDKCRCDIQIGR
jgi:hypothetical protein